MMDMKSSQLPAVSATASRPTHLTVVPQMPYKCPSKQGGWTKQAPIKLGIKLTDATDPGYVHPHGYDDKVLNYEGVGGTILCRLINVRQSSQAAHTHHSNSLPFPSLPGARSESHAR